MGLRKGQTNNRNGRPKGSKNRNNELIRESFKNLVESNLQQLESDLQELTPQERIKALIDLAKFVVPTLKAADLNLSSDPNFTPIEIILQK